MLSRNGSKQRAGLNQRFTLSRIAFWQSTLIIYETIARFFQQEAEVIMCLVHAPLSLKPVVVWHRHWLEMKDSGTVQIQTKCFFVWVFILRIIFRIIRLHAHSNNKTRIYYFAHKFHTFCLYLDTLWYLVLQLYLSCCKYRVYENGFNFNVYGGYIIHRPISANIIYSASVGLLLSHRLRHWPSIKPTLDKYLVFAGMYNYALPCKHQ